MLKTSSCLPWRARRRQRMHLATRAQRSQMAPSTPPEWRMEELILMRLVHKHPSAQRADMSGHAADRAAGVVTGAAVAAEVLLGISGDLRQDIAAPVDQTALAQAAAQHRLGGIDQPGRAVRDDQQRRCHANGPDRQPPAWQRHRCRARR